MAEGGGGCDEQEKKSFSEKSVKKKFCTTNSPKKFIHCPNKLFPVRKKKQEKNNPRKRTLRKKSLHGKFEPRKIPAI